MKSVLSAALLLSVSSFVFAASTEKPAACPTVSALQTAGVAIIENEDNSWSGWINSHNFDTNDNWSFAIFDFKADNEAAARDVIQQSLASLVFVQGPIAFELNDKPSWVCVYNDQSGHTAVTATPTLDINTFKMSLKKVL